MNQENKNIKPENGNIFSSNDIIALMMKQDESKETIYDSAVDLRNKIKDSYGNSLLAIGNKDKVEDFTNYDFTNDTLNFWLWITLYNSSWVFRRAIDKPAQDEIKCGITIISQQDVKPAYTYVNKARTDLINLLQWGSLFGGALAVVMMDTFSDDDYVNSASINIKKIKSTKVIRYYVTDRWYGVQPSTETVTDMKDLDFGKPKYYEITFADGKSLKVHHDYILRYEHRTAPRLIKNGQLQGWGYAEGAHIINELNRDDKLKSSIQSLIDKSLIEVIKMSGMRGVFMGGDAGSEQQLKKRLEMVNWGRSYNSLTFLDKDDEYQQNTYGGLTGLSDLLDNNMLLIAAALEMQGVLFGDLKGGLAIDSTAMERYDETINGRCESYVRPVYEKLLRIIYMICGIDDKVEFTFNSLLMKQKSEKRMEDMQKLAELSNILLNAGVITTKQFAKAFQNYTLHDTIDFNLTDEEIEKLDESFQNEFEGIDLEGGVNEDNSRRN